MPDTSLGTGRELAVAFGRRYAGEDWIAELSKRSGLDRNTVEWHLQEDMAPPDAVRNVAAEMESEREQPGDAMAREDLPLVGLPENLGKLHDS